MQYTKWSSHLIAVLMLCILGLVGLNPALANDKRVALLIANKNYATSPLKNPINDAKLIANKLRQLDYQVTTLTDANRYQMIEKIEAFGRSAQGADSAVFYYSGHGMQDDYKQNFLLPVEAQISTESSIRAYGVEAYEVINALKKAKPRISLVIFDACRDNPFAGVRGNRNFSVEGYQTDSELLVAYATQTGQYAQDGSGENSPYAIALAKQLENAKITPLLNMFDNVKKEVKELTNNKQSPTKMGDAEVNTFLLDAPSSHASNSNNLIQDIEPKRLKGILNVAENYNILFEYPAIWGKTFSIKPLKDSNYSHILDMSSIDSKGYYFSEDKMRLTTDIMDTKLFRTEIVAELYSTNPKNDSGYVEGIKDPHIFSAKQKSLQFIPLIKIYDDQAISRDVSSIIEGQEPTGRIDYTNKHTNMWGNVDGYHDFFKLSYISSKDNLLRGMCHFSLRGQDYDFNLGYSCLLYNKDTNLLVRISTPLSNATQNTELSKEHIFRDVSSEEDVQQSIRKAKTKVIRGDFNDVTKAVIEDIQSVAESVTVF